MANIIKPKYTTTAAKVPTTSDIADGEFCINTTDKTIYQRVSAAIIAVANYMGIGSALPGGTNGRVLYQASGNLAQSANLQFDGTNLGVGITPTTSLHVSRSTDNYTNTAGADALILMNNPNANGQSSLVNIINGAMRSKWRTDYVGNINWVSNGGTHQFWTGGDYSDGGASRFEVAATFLKSTLLSGTGVRQVTVAADGTFGSAPYASVTTVASSATPTPTGDSRENELYVTAQAANAVIAAPTGTASQGNKLFIHIIPTGTYTISFNAVYEAIGVTLPTGMTSGKDLILTGKFNSTRNKWQILAVTVRA